MKYFIITLFLLFSIFQLKSQDAVFSQFYLSPLNLNPALAGAECGDQLTFNYRSKSAYFSGNSLSYDRPFSLKNGDKVGAGVKYVNYEADYLGFNTKAFGLAFSYDKMIFKTETSSHFLSGGIEVAQIFRETGGGALGCPSCSSDEKDFDINVGLLYHADFQKVKNFRVGISGYHLNQENYNVNFTTSERLSVRFAFHSQVDIKITERIDFRPRSVYSTQGNGGTLISDFGFRFSLNKASNSSLECSIGGKKTSNNEATTSFVSAAFFYKRIGFSALSEFSGKQNGKIDLEGALVFRFCKS